MERVITYEPRPFGTEAEFAGRRLQPTRERVPIQMDDALRHATSDLNVGALHRHHQLQGLHPLDRDPHCNNGGRDPRSWPDIRACDQDRLHAYHTDLHREAMRRLSAMSPTDAGRRREEQRLGAIEREYRAKIEDLGRHYAMRVTVEWVQTLELVMPVQRFGVQIRRRKAQRVIHLDWNPLARRLETPACEFSFAPERPTLVCDDALHLVTAAGFAPCAGCGRPFCRACHRVACPRCASAVQLPEPFT